MKSEPQSGTTTGSARNPATLLFFVIAMSVVMGLVGQRQRQRPCSCFPPREDPGVQYKRSIGRTSQARLPKSGLPRLLALGAGECIPYRNMAPLLEDLKREYEGELDLVVIDVRESPDAWRQYNIQSVPTQIFFDAFGAELYRHEGFCSKEEILKKWEEFGIGLRKKKHDEPRRGENDEKYSF